MMKPVYKRIKHHPEATKAAIVDYDTAWFGETFKVNWTDGQAGPDLWVHAKLYLLGNNEPLALVYRIDLRNSRTLKRARPK